jgi:hypothetical protein
MEQLLRQPTFFFTWLVLCFALVVIGLTIFFLSKRFFSTEARRHLVLITMSSFTVLLVVEATLRITGYTENYSEARVGSYNFICHGSFQDTLHVWPKNGTHEIGDRVQFLYPRSTNSLGLSDREWEKNKQDSVFRIIALGDSFTEGDGAPADSTWPILLEQQLLHEGKSVEVFNAGVCGSDPFHELMLLKYRLMDYQPDLVIVTLAMQDLLEDIGVKGGMERFDPKHGRTPLLFELVYAYSHIARLIYNRILGYSWVLVREKSPSFRNEIVEDYIPSIFEQFSEISGGLRIVFVLYPHQMQTTEGYDSDFKAALVENSRLTGMPMYDIRSCYLESIEQSGKPTEYFWWKHDGHHNSDGYLMMAHCIRQELSL